MLYGISFLQVDNSAIQEAILNNAPKDRISDLKKYVAFNAVYGFNYEKVSFEKLANILSNDFAFSPFRYKTKEEGAIYNQDKHINAFGGIRGRLNTYKEMSWVCLDVDNTNVSDYNMHKILAMYNHHIARTSDESNQYKYRVILPLNKEIKVSSDIYKLFIKSIANFLSISIDNLGASQCYYGYSGRNVLTISNGIYLDPLPHLNVAKSKYDELETLRQQEFDNCDFTEALNSPYSTFKFAFDCSSGEGTNMLLGAITKAKELGADKDYIKKLVVNINNFWDKPMPRHRLEATVMTAI